MTFLEKAQEIHDKKGSEPSSILMQDCWPELLDLVEAAQEHRCDCSQDAPANCRGRVCCELVHALTALNARAGIRTWEDCCEVENY